LTKVYKTTEKTEKNEKLENEKKEKKEIKQIIKNLIGEIGESIYYYWRICNIDEKNDNFKNNICYYIFQNFFFSFKGSMSLVLSELTS
jgi:hypothetical protein